MSTDPRGLTAPVDVPAEVAPHQGDTVGRGVVHRPRAPVTTVLVMVENAGVSPGGE